MTTYEMLKEQFARTQEELQKATPGSKEYHELLKDWCDLHEKIMVEDKAQTDLEFKNIETFKPWYKKLDINTVVSGGVTVGSMLLMLNFEKIGNITSKAFSWIPKPRMK